MRKEDEDHSKALAERAMSVLSGADLLRKPPTPSLAENAGLAGEPKPKTPPDTPKNDSILEDALDALSGRKPDDPLAKNFFKPK